VLLLLLLLPLLCRFRAVPHSLWTVHNWAHSWAAGGHSCYSR